MAVGVSLGCSFYNVGGKSFFYLPLHPEQVKNAFQKAGFVNVQYETKAVSYKADDSTGVMFVKGMK